MKIGHFDLVAIEYRNGFRSSCDFAGIHLWSGERFPTKQEALDYGIKILEKELKDALDSLKPKYQKKPEPVDAIQWFPGVKIEGLYLCLSGCYKYNNQRISPGEWIVSGKVVTNEDFQQDYEVVT